MENKIVTKETSEVIVRIFTDIGGLYQNYDTFNINHGYTRLDHKSRMHKDFMAYSLVFDPKPYTIQVGNIWNHTNIISPFTLNILIKSTSTYDWLNEDDQQSMLQREVDSIFAPMAKKACMIIDHESYLSTPERYMLVPLLLSPKLRKRYKANPILRYGRADKYLKKILFNAQNMVKILGDSVNTGSYIETVDGSYRMVARGRECSHSQGIISTDANSEILARWGILGKTNQCSVTYDV